MVEKHYKVQVQGDHIGKLTAARPIPAVAELIWNAVDGDATRVDVEVEADAVGMCSVTVRDNGHGIPIGDIEKLFGQLGGSWKKQRNRSKTKSRILHGKEGKGRFKALGIGRVADWHIDQPVKRVDGSKGIVDLMLSRAVPRNRPDEREHLIVELKRPSVTIGSDEISQVRSYAFAIAADERFEPLKTRWTFWVVSNALDKTGKLEARQSGRPRGQVYKSEEGHIEVWCKTWSEIIEECRARLRFVEEKLQANIDKESSLRYLKKTYEKYLSGVLEIEETNPDEEGDDADKSPIAVS